MTREFTLGIPHCNEPPEIFAATLAAVRASSVQPQRVIVIDNGDEAIRDFEGTGRPWHVVRSDRNLGCAGAWNAILRLSATDTTIIINADCAVTPDTFDRMLEEPASAIVCGHGFACFRMNAEIYAKVGPFDEAYYPVYWEDTDYRYRCKIAGMPIVEWPSVEADRTSFGRARYGTGISHGWRHEDGRGYQGWTGEKAAWFQQCWENNRARYAAKWGGAVGAVGEETFTEPFNGKQEKED